MQLNLKLKNIKLILLFKILITFDKLSLEYIINELKLLDFVL